MSLNELTDQKVGTAELLFRCARQMGLQPTWITPNGLFAVTCNGSERYINFTHSPLNNHTAASLARDKYATRMILERQGFPNIPFLRPQSLHEAEGFLHTYGKIIAKPIYGSGARDIHIVTRPAELQALRIRRYILEKYITGKEMRYLVLKGRVIGVHQSEYGTSVDEHRPLQRISHPPVAWDALLTSMSIQISHVLDLRFAAVDYLVTPQGHHYVLEVNTMPGLKWFHAPSSGPAVDVARQFLDAFISDAQQLSPAH